MEQLLEARDLLYSMLYSMILHGLSNLIVAIITIVKIECYYVCFL